MLPTIMTKQKGSGDLVLTNGVRQVVIWEIEILSDGSFGKGSINGDRKHLATAAKDGCASLLLGLDVTAAIAIDSYANDWATFRTLSVSRKSRDFHAQSIQGSRPTASGKTTVARRPKTWKTGSLAMSGCVCIVFDDDVPVALVPQDARELAAELIEFADRVESLSLVNKN
jgi:hypothetical protein